jgi:fructose-specific phosphotransferase system IIC component
VDPVAAGAATITAAKLSGVADYLALLLFCLLATSSFLYLELSAVFRPVAADALMKKLRNWLDTHQEQVIIVISLLLGFWLAGKSLYLLVT